jgi:hypothetical protein
VWVPSGVNSWTAIVFILHNDVLQLVKNKVLPILFTDDASFIKTNSDSVNMDHDLKVVLEITKRCLIQTEC